MKTILGLFFVVLLATPASAGQNEYFPGGVYEWHDRFPSNSHRHADQASDNECNENHNLRPDGDGDCDDPKSVPEPGSLGLFAIGLGALALATRRRR